MKIDYLVGGGGSGGGNGSIDVYENGILKKAGATILNFLGVNNAVYDAGGAQANISNPPLNFSSHFNTNDGNSNASIANVAIVSRLIASPTSPGAPFSIGTWGAGSAQNTLRNSTITYAPGQAISLATNTSTFDVIIYGSDDVTPIATNSITINANGSFVSSGITITVSSFGSESSKYKCNLSISYNLSTILTSGGRFSIKLQHNNSPDGTYIKTQGPIFYDPDLPGANIVSISIVETMGFIVTKQVSGVDFYTTNSRFTVDIPEIDYINDRSYPSVQVEVIGPNYGLPLLSLTGLQITGWSTYYLANNMSYLNGTWAINATDWFYLGTGAMASTRYIDWAPSAYVDSGTSTVAVNTMSNNNTRNFEDFRIENKRLTSALSAYWDPSQNLNTYDSGNGLQYLNTRLIYPSTNFGLYSPSAGSQPNYSAASGDKLVYIEMYDTGVSHTNGQIQFGDHNLTETDLATSDVLIDISLDGAAWFSLNNLYLGGVINNGSPCRINDDIHALNIDNRIQFTFGTAKFTSVATGGPQTWGMVMRVTFKGNPNGKSKYIGSLLLADW